MTGETCAGCGRSDGFHLWWCQDRPATDITVCQDCGHVIDVERVTFAGNGYAISLCQRRECIAARLAAAMDAEWERGRAARAAEWSRFATQRAILWGLMPPDPKAFLRITGV